jgi:hypothetical protein
MAGIISTRETSHELLRREIERQTRQYLTEGGQIIRLSTPRFEPNRQVQVTNPLMADR